MNEGSKQLSSFVWRKIKIISESTNLSGSKTSLANLRRGVGKKPGSIPEIWDITLNELPERFISKDGNPTYGEWASHISLTLFALHQQGKDLNNKCMNQENKSLGDASRALKNAIEDDGSRVKRRFDAIATALDMDEMSYHLRGLVQLFKSKDIPLDYPQLARDIYEFQFPNSRDQVRLRWGQAFYRSDKEDNASNQK
jgi:CRISPR system Cascade subunit CasB